MFRTLDFNIYRNCTDKKIFDKSFCVYTEEVLFSQISFNNNRSYDAFNGANTINVALLRSEFFGKIGEKISFLLDSFLIELFRYKNLNTCQINIIGDYLNFPKDLKFFSNRIFAENKKIPSGEKKNKENLIILRSLFLSFTRKWANSSALVQVSSKKKNRVNTLKIGMNFFIFLSTQFQLKKKAKKLNKLSDGIRNQRKGYMNFFSRYLEKNCFWKNFKNFLNSFLMDSNFSINKNSIFSIIKKNIVTQFYRFNPKNLTKKYEENLRIIPRSIFYYLDFFLIKNISFRGNRKNYDASLVENKFRLKSIILIETIIKKINSNNNKLF